MKPITAILGLSMYLQCSPFLIELIKADAKATVLRCRKIMYIVRNKKQSIPIHYLTTKEKEKLRLSTVTMKDEVLTITL